MRPILPEGTSALEVRRLRDGQVVVLLRTHYHAEEWEYLKRSNVPEFGPIWSRWQALILWIELGCALLNSLIWPVRRAGEHLKP